LLQRHAPSLRRTGDAQSAIAAALRFLHARDI
jgi:hypothetical protein